MRRRSGIRMSAVFFSAALTMTAALLPGRPAQADESVSLLHPTVSTTYRYLNEPDTYWSLSTVRYPAVKLSQSEARQFPALEGALENYSEAKKEIYEAALTNLGAKRQQAITEWRAENPYASDEDTSYMSYAPFSQTLTAKIARADSAAFSILERFDWNMGGAHGYYEDSGTAFDTQSGEMLSFSDAVTDCDAAAAHTMEKLAEYYPQLDIPLAQETLAADMKRQDASADYRRENDAAQSTDDSGDGLSDSSADAAQSTDDSGDGLSDSSADAAGQASADENGSSEDASVCFRWVLTSQGVEIIFPPYVLASYAEGEQKILLPFSEYPEIFNPRYSSVSDKWIVPVSYDTGGYADLDGDGSSERISFDSEWDDYGDLTSRTITAGDSSCTQSELYVYGTEAALVKSQHGFDLYCFDSLEDDWRMLSVFHLSGDGIDLIQQSGDGSNSAVGSETGDLGARQTWDYTDGTAGDGSDSVSTYTEYALTDPNAMLLSSHMNVLSTYSAYRTYHVGDSGWPAADDPMYVADNVDDVVLTLLKTLDLNLVDENGADAGTKNFLASSEFTILRTDGVRTVDLRSVADPGVIARLSGQFTDYPDTLDNGLTADEMFSGSRYAG